MKLIQILLPLFCVMAVLMIAYRFAVRADRKKSQAGIQNSLLDCLSDPKSQFGKQIREQLGDGGTNDLKASLTEAKKQREISK